MTIRSRRRLFCGVAAALLAAQAGCGGTEPTVSAPSAGKSLQAPPPIVALNCPVGNAYRCDRLLVEVRLPLPADRLQAWVAGRPVRGLRAVASSGRGPRHGAAGLTWSGHVQPAGLTEPRGPLEIHSQRPNYWAGTPPVRARVRIHARLERGGPLTEVFPAVNLLPGFG